MAAGEEDATDRPRRPAGRTTAKKTSGGRSGSGSADTKHSARGVSAAQAMRHAVEQLRELLGRAPEGVSAVRPTDDGWQADLEVVELERVPSTTSVMASYRVTLDEVGEIVSYERTRRYTRGQTDRR
ncbi:gas vesicle protein [Streptomyces griseus]|uniref:gas vesicle protein GvpO n=1 Tax=Streptomyces griseus TaxID=1911 RepID=UPI00083FF5C3|nr:gas vesicle protein [Streptomyces griseus]